MPKERTRRASEVAVVYVRRPFCGSLWMGPKGGEVSISTGCTLLGLLGHVTDGCWGAEAGWRSHGFQPEWPPGIPYTTVTWVGQVTFVPVELSHMWPLCYRFCISLAHLVWIQYKAWCSDYVQWVAEFPSSSCSAHSGVWHQKRVMDTPKFGKKTTHLLKCF